MERDRDRPPSTPGTRTRAVHGAGQAHPGGLNPPLVRSATFAFESLEAMNAEQARGRDSAYYQRVAHPTVRACERHLAALEGAEDALLFASGMAAITAVLMANVSAGDHVVALDQSYGGTHEALRWGVEHFGWRVTFVDGRRPADWPAAFTGQTQLFHVESPTNPMNLIVDLAAAADTRARARREALGRQHLRLADRTASARSRCRPRGLQRHQVDRRAQRSGGGRGDRQRRRDRKGVEGAQGVRRRSRARSGGADRAELEDAAAARRGAERHRARAGAPSGRPRRRCLRVSYPGLDRASRSRHRRAADDVGLRADRGVRGGGRRSRPRAGWSRRCGWCATRRASAAPNRWSRCRRTRRTSSSVPTAARRAGIPEGLVRLSVGIEDAEDLRGDLDQALARAIVPNAAAAR